MLRVDHNGFEVWCDGLRVSGSQLVFLSLFGTQTAVRAVWADLVKERRGGIMVGATYARLQDEDRYHTFRSMLAKQWLHTIVLHTDATTLVSPFRSSFYLVGDEPTTQYWPRFNRMCSTPMRLEWRDEVWKIGREKDLIQPLGGFGALGGFQVNVGNEWNKAIQEAVLAGRLS